jgi:hypothetical protein
MIKALHHTNGEFRAVCDARHICVRSDVEVTQPGVEEFDLVAGAIETNDATMFRYQSCDP